MKLFLFGSCLLLSLICIWTSCGETMVFRTKRSLNGQPSKVTFNMFISEKGSHFNEKVTLNMDENTVTHHVPAHRDISESDYLLDYNSNVVVTRLPRHGVCHVRPRTPDEPSMDVLKKSMDMVSTGKYQIMNGTIVLSTEWIPKRLADRSRLSKIVVDFCRGFAIYELEEMEQDGVIVSKGRAVRTKRSGDVLMKPIPFCKDPFNGYNHLKIECPGETNYKTECSFILTPKTCVHWITCDFGVFDVAKKAGGVNCTALHRYDQALCCNLHCP